MPNQRIREYEIVKGPYSGSYGAVSIGRHTTLNTLRAIKRLHHHVKPEIIREEALKQHEVKSPYVVQIYDFFEDEQAILMEFCPIGLDHYLRERFRQTGGKIPYNDARELLYGILRGLNDAHHVSVIHGDIKPANVRFGVGKTEDEIGLPKLGDFGAARRLRQDVPVLRGSTNWMAPEVIDGADATKASGYFSFGLLAYLVLTGRHPFFANDPSCLDSEEDNIRNPTFRPEPLGSLRLDVPSTVADLIMELLSRDPDAREVSEQQLKAALSEPLAPTHEPSVQPAPTRIYPSDSEVAAIEQGYETARELFFVDFRPKDAVEILDDLFQAVAWERFKGQRVVRLADCWSLRAYINNSGGYFSQAVAAATNGLSVDGDHVNSLHARGYAYIQRGEHEEAQNDLERALELVIEPSKRRQIRQLLDTVRARLDLNVDAT